MCPFERKHACFRRASRSASERKRPYGNAMGTSAVCLRSVVEFSGENGTPERIRTADPQIRSLVEPIEIIRVRYRKGHLSRLSLEFSMHRCKACYRTERRSIVKRISPPKTKIIAE